VRDPLRVQKRQSKFVEDRAERVGFEFTRKRSSNNKECSGPALGKPFAAKVRAVSVFSGPGPRKSYWDVIYVEELIGFVGLSGLAGIPVGCIVSSLVSV